MSLQLEGGDPKKFICVGDKVLIKPRVHGERTKSGLILPASVTEKENLQSGYIYRVGPGYPIPSIVEDEPWKEGAGQPKYVPLQAQEGDLAVYLQSAGFEIELDGEKFIILPHQAILLLIRDDELFL